MVIGILIVYVYLNMYDLAWEESDSTPAES